MSQPNIILLTIDTLRADRVGCYGQGASLTPNLDRLAAQGVRFEQAITGGSWTQAAFPTIMTSTYAAMHGGCLGPLSPQRPSPVSALTEHGYQTAGFVTSPLLGRVYGYDRGFTEFFELIPEEQDPFLRRVKGGQKLLQQPLTHQIYKLAGKDSRPARVYVSAEEVNEAVCSWLQKTSAPFFAWIHYMDVHWPYHLDANLVQPRQIAQAWRDLNHLHQVNWQGAQITAEQRDHYIHLYETAVRYADAQIGHLLDYLQQSGLTDDTVLIVVSDHGEEFLERHYWGHVETNLHDEIIKVPLLMHVPGQTSGQVVPDQVCTLDIMPTILDLCHVPTPAGLLGKTLMPFWREDREAEVSAIAIAERWRNEVDVSHMVAVRTPQFKYIWGSNQPDQPRLYNLQADPAENHNVVAQYPEQAQDLHGHLKTHLQRATSVLVQTADTATPELDADIIRRLRDLGYVE